MLHEQSMQNLALSFSHRSIVLISERHSAPMEPGLKFQLENAGLPVLFQLVM